MLVETGSSCASCSNSKELKNDYDKNLLMMLKQIMTLKKKAYAGCIRASARNAQVLMRLCFNIAICFCISSSDQLLFVDLLSLLDKTVDILFVSSAFPICKIFSSQSNIIQVETYLYL